MNSFLFDEFNTLNAKAWKQKIQVDLKGADYNKTLLWQSDEGITVKPFYTQEDRKNLEVTLPKKGFNICETIFVGNVKIANTLAQNAIQKGATAIHFKANKTFNFKHVLHNINTNKTLVYFTCSFLNPDFQIELANFCKSKNCYFNTDIIGNLAETGNWFHNLKEDHLQLQKIVSATANCLSISGDLYQNAGANCTQQLAYTLAHANEYLNYFGDDVADKIHFNFAVGSNYFFEIAKLRAFRILWDSLLHNYQIHHIEAHIFTTPSLRNKTIYDYNVNLLRTTSECMSAILGGSNTIANIAYDHIYHKSNHFGQRIARNQLLMLQQESYLANGQNIADGSYYIESLTQQLAQNALHLFKQIEKSGGFLKLLKTGTIQKKIQESAHLEEQKFHQNDIVLLGTNVQPNPKDTMKEHLELYPFVKQRRIKTLITPIVRKRLSETVEKQRLDNE